MRNYRSSLSVVMIDQQLMMKKLILNDSLSNQVRPLKKKDPNFLQTYLKMTRGAVRGYALLICSTLIMLVSYLYCFFQTITNVS